MQTCWDAAASAGADVNAELARARCAPCEAGLPSLRHISSLLGAQAEVLMLVNSWKESAADRLSQQVPEGLLSSAGRSADASWALAHSWLQEGLAVCDYLVGIFRLLPARAGRSDATRSDQSSSWCPTLVMQGYH